MDTHSNLLRMSRLDYYYLVLKLLNFCTTGYALMVGSAKDLKCAINEKCPELCHSVAKTLYNPCKRQHLPLFTTIKKPSTVYSRFSSTSFFFLLMIQFKRFLRFLFRYIEYRVPLAGVAKLALISTICHSDRNKRLTQLGVVGGNPKKELLLFQNNRSRLS